MNEGEPNVLKHYMVWQLEKSVNPQYTDEDPYWNEDTMAHHKVVLHQTGVFKGNSLFMLLLQAFTWKFHRPRTVTKTKWKLTDSLATD